MSQFTNNDPWSEFQPIGGGAHQPSAAADPFADFEVVQPVQAPNQPLQMSSVQPQPQSYAPQPQAQPAPGVTPDNYEDGFRQELKQLTVAAQQRGEPGVSNGAQMALLDQWRVKAGLNPLEKGFENFDATAAANELNQQSTLRDYAGAPGRVAAQLPGNIVSLFSPDAGNKLLQNVDAYYGQPQSTGANIYGQAVGGAATTVASLPAGPLGMAGMYGAAGAGSVRGDIANRRAEGQDISGTQEFGSALGVGLLDAVSGYLGGKAFGSIGAKLAKVPGLKELVQTQGAPGILNVIKRIAPEMLSQGGQEALNTFADNVVKKVGYVPETDTTEGVLQSGIMGAAMAPFGGAVHGRMNAGETLSSRPAAETMKQRVTRLESELEAERKVSRTDELTGIGNRKQEGEDIARIYGDADTKKEHVGVVETDLANFKVVNDEIGHDAGDALLKAEAEAIRETLRGDTAEHPADYTGSVNRVGGDEFPIKLRNVDSPEKADIVMKRINELFQKKAEAIIGDKLPKEAYPFIAWGTEIRKPGDTRTPQELTKAAEHQVIPRKNSLKAERGVPETREALSEFIRKHKEKAAAPVAEFAKPDYAPVSDILDTIPHNQDDKFAIENALNEEPGKFVRVKVTPEQFSDIPRENIDREKIEAFRGELAKGGKAPAIIATTGEDGNLRLRDGRHRLLAAAADARAKGADPSKVQVDAVVPESWAQKQGLISGGKIGQDATSAAESKPRKGITRVTAEAQEYTQQAGLRTPVQNNEYAKVDTAQAKKIADAYDAAKHDPSDPKVKKAYDAFKKETLDQWNFLKSKGVKMEPWAREGQPYKNSAEMQADVEKGHLFYYTGGDMPADHPMGAKIPSGETYNEIFRAVHDYFGHTKDGNQFGPRGEENAWRAHSVMYGPEARKAMTAETRGQNSWVNYGPKGEFNRANPTKTVYAEQKAALLPDEFVESGSGKPPKPPAKVTTESGDEGLPPRAQIEAGESDIPESKSRMAKIWEATKDILRDPTKGPIADIEKKIIQSRGRIALASMDADTLGSEFTKQAKAAGVDPESRDVQASVEAILRNKSSSPELRKWANTARSSLDTASSDLAAKLRSVGLEKQATAVEDNLGSYLKNVPKESVSPTGKMRAWARNSLALSPSFGKTKRDKFIVWDNSKPLGKFDTEEQAQTAYDAKLKERKEAMIRTGSKERGVSEADLNSRAGKGLKITEPISDDWRQANEVHDPRYLVARSIIETRHNAEMVDLFQFAAKQYGQQAPEGLDSTETAKWAEENGMVKLPEAGRLHALDGTYVPKNVGDRLREHAKLPGEVERLYLAALSAWKASKTVYNPGTHVRNWLTNAMVFADLADTSPANPRNWNSYRKAAASLANKATDPVFRRAVERGLIGNEYSSTELKAVKESFGKSDNAIDAMFSAAGKVNKGAMKAYDIGDSIFKLAIVHNNMRKGMSVDDAIADADEWMPNYARTGKITKWLRKTPVGSPFVSFFDQSARIAMRAITRKPLKVAKIMAIPFMIDALSRAILGVDDKEEKLIHGDSAMKRWTQTLTNPIMPVRDAKGRVLTLDLKSILPLANDLVPESRNGSVIVPWMFSGPLSNTVIEQLSGKERFTGRNFLSDKMTTGQTLAARGKRLVDTLAPIPSLATYGRERIANAATGNSEENTARAIVGAVGGLNIRTPYIADEIVKKIIQHQIGESDRAEARALMNEWNDTYKPGNQKKLNMADLVRGMRSSSKRTKHTARDAAAEAILQGDQSAAEAMVKEFNQNRPGRMTELTLEEARRQADVFKRQKKER